MSITGGAIGASINGESSLIMDTWSAYPAQFNLNMNSKTIYNASSITTGVLNYTTLNPPVGGGGNENIAQTLAIGDDANQENLLNVASFTNIETGFLDPDAINPTIKMGMLPGLGGRVNIWQDGDVVSPFNSSALLAVGQLNCGGGINVGSQQNPSNIVVDGAVVINEDGAPTGQTILSANSSNQLVLSGGLQVGNLTTGSPLSSGFHSIYPADGFKYTGLYSKSVGALGTATLGITNNSPTRTPTGNLECNAISATTATVGTLNYTTLSPPIPPPGGGETLSQTLTLGNNAGGQNITNVGSIFSGSYEGTGGNGLFQIGNNALNNYVNDNGSGTPQLSLGFCTLNMGGSNIINLNDPTSSDMPATKNYVDNSISNVRSGSLYISGSPDIINVAIPNNGAITNIWISQAFSKPSGVPQQLMITFNNKNILSGPNNTNLITGLVDFSNNGVLWVPSSIDPYGNGFLFSPSFLAWVTIPSNFTTYYIRIRGLQTNVSVPNYQINANIMIASYSG